MLLILTLVSFLGATTETRSFYIDCALQNETTMQKLQSAPEAADVNVKMIW